MSDVDFSVEKKPRRALCSGQRECDETRGQKGTVVDLPGE